MMFKDSVPIFKLQLKIALKEKMTFIYSLIIPIVVLLLNNRASLNNSETLYTYWSYIVVTSILNSFMINFIRMREDGSLKTLSYMVGSKTSIIFNKYLVQLLIIEIEIFIFDLAISLLGVRYSLSFYLYGFLMTLITTTLAIAATSILFRLRVKQGTFNIIINIILFWGLFLLTLRPSGILNYLFTIINPFQFVLSIYNFINNSVFLNGLVVICALVFLVVSYFNLRNLSVKSQLNRV